MNNERGVESKTVTNNRLCVMQSLMSENYFLWKRPKKPLQLFVSLLASRVGHVTKYLCGVVLVPVKQVAGWRALARSFWTLVDMQ
jgi:hypothetical protein